MTQTTAPSAAAQGSAPRQGRYLVQIQHLTDARGGEVEPMTSEWEQARTLHGTWPTAAAATAWAQDHTADDTTVDDFTVLLVNIEREHDPVAIAHEESAAPHHFQHHAGPAATRFYHPQEEDEHIILVALGVRGHTREGAERALHQVMPRTGSWPHALVDCWWIAEDERHDGSDNSSAVFVDKGAQTQAQEVLVAHGFGA